MADGKLVALLVRLDGNEHDPPLRGGWYLETGYGPFTTDHEIFVGPEEAHAWFADRLAE